MKSLLLSNCASSIELTDFDLASVEASPPTEKVLPFAIWKKSSVLGYPTKCYL